MQLPDGTFRKICKRWNRPGHAHELTFSCYKKFPLFQSDRPKIWFIEALEQARTKHRFELWAYVIMPDHAHLLIFPSEGAGDIAEILQSIKQPVSRRAMNYLRKHQSPWLERLAVQSTNRLEHRFWQSGGGYDRNIHELETAHLVVDYLHNNPVRKQLVQTSTDWKWSSAGWYEGKWDVPIKMDGSPG